MYTIEQLVQQSMFESTIDSKVRVLATLMM